ncbi:membrane protein [Cutibacterium acnes JCM 18918]|nr:membrane protein [Cutibacterium acnes JCM 18918]
MRNPWFWVLLALVLISAACMVHTYVIVHADTEVEQQGQKGVIPGITNQSLKLAFHYAWPTAAVWSAIFIFFLIDSEPGTCTCGFSAFVGERASRPGLACT